MLFRSLWRHLGYDPAVHGPRVLRVEFQVRRDALRELLIDAKAAFSQDVDTFLQGDLGRLWSYLTTRWVHLHRLPGGLGDSIDDLTVGVYKRLCSKRWGRAPLEPWWAALADRFGHAPEAADIRRQQWREIGRAHV